MCKTAIHSLYFFVSAFAHLQHADGYHIMIVHASRHSPLNLNNDVRAAPWCLVFCLPQPTAEQKPLMHFSGTETISCQDIELWKLFYSWMWIFDQSRRSRRWYIDVIMLWHGKFLWSPWRAFWISLSKITPPARERFSFRKFCCIAKIMKIERIEKNEQQQQKK